jgi:hypothetical protein
LSGLLDRATFLCRDYMYKPYIHTYIECTHLPPSSNAEKTPFTLAGFDLTTYNSSGGDDTTRPRRHAGHHNWFFCMHICHSFTKAMQKLPSHLCVVSRET